MNNKRATDAAIVEDLAAELKDLVLLLRSNASDATIYRELYAARHKLGQVATRYGVGVPRKK